MRRPLVSVLMPAYNHATYVEEALDSVLADGYPELELLVLDDGSRDDTLQRVEAWVARNGHHFRRTLVRRQENAGICPTLNRLVAEAKGDFVTLLASDDALRPGGIEARVAHLETHPGQMAVFADAEVMGSCGESVMASAIRDLHRGNPRALADPRWTATALILRWCVPGPVFLARRETWDPEVGIGPYDEGLVVEDQDFYLRLAARRAVGYLDRSVARYRVHDASACRQTLRESVFRDNLRCIAENRPRFQGLEHFLLGLILAERRPGLRGYLSRRTLALFRSWIKRV